MALEDYGTIWVCTDCYFAEANGASLGPDGLWYCDGSDTPCDREPLCKTEGFHVHSNTCSNHEIAYHTEPDPDDEDDWIDVPDPCPHCGSDELEDGIAGFASWPCQGCGSTLGGSRYRMSLWKVSNA